MKENVGVLITDSQKRVLLSRSIGAPAEYNPFTLEASDPRAIDLIYEAPHVLLDHRTFSIRRLEQTIRAKYDISVSVRQETAPAALTLPPQIPVGLVVSTESLPVCRLYAADLHPNVSGPDDDAHSFIDLSGMKHNLAEFPLGPYAQMARWMIQNEEITL